MTLTEQLWALHDLHVRGQLTDAEFARAKARVLASQAPSRPPIPGGPPVAPPPPPPAVKPLNPVVPGVGLALGAASLGGG